MTMTMSELLVMSSASRRILLIISRIHCTFTIVPLVNVMMISLGLNSEGRRSSDGQYRPIMWIAVKLALANGAKDIHCECLLLYCGTKWASPSFLCPACELIGQGSVIRFRM